MIRPDPKAAVVYSEEYKLVMDIAHAVTPEYAKQMLFWLFHRVEGNGANSDSINEIIKEEKKRELPIAQYLKVDCSKAKDVQDNLLIPVLEQMSANLASINNMILNRANEQLSELEQAYHIISSQVGRAMGASINLDERRYFNNLINSTIGVVTNALSQLYLGFTPQL